MRCRCIKLLRKVWLVLGHLLDTFRGAGLPALCSALVEGDRDDALCFQSLELCFVALDADGGSFVRAALPVLLFICAGMAFRESCKPSLRRVNSQVVGLRLRREQCCVCRRIEEVASAERRLAIRQQAVLLRSCRILMPDGRSHASYCRTDQQLLRTTQDSQAKQVVSKREVQEHA